MGESKYIGGTIDSVPPLMKPQPSQAAPRSALNCHDQPGIAQPCHAVIITQPCASLRTQPPSSTWCSARPYTRSCGNARRHSWGSS
jgi:hypothetical protein